MSATDIAATTIEDADAKLRKAVLRLKQSREWREVSEREEKAARDDLLGLLHDET